MKELKPEQFGQLLNRSLQEIKPSTLASLRKARQQALARYDARHTAPAFAWAGLSTWFGHGASSHRRYYYWTAGILLAACLFSGVAYWQHASEHDISEVDIAILTDDMPMHVYVD